MPPSSPSHAIRLDRGGGDDGRTGDRLPLPTIERARHWEARVTTKVRSSK